MFTLDRYLRRKASQEAHMIPKFKVIEDSTGTWCWNGLRFDTREEAEQYATDLLIRGTVAREEAD